MRRLSVIALFIIISFNSRAQSLCEKLANLKTQCYGFIPTSLTTKQQEAKSAELDKFWNLAKTDPNKALPCLKEMILNENNDPYFCFDASTLILSLDRKQQYLDVVLAGVNKTDLKQLQLETYLQVCFSLAKNGKDITAATEKLISTPGAHVYLTIHVIDLSAIDASLFLYNTMTTESAERCLINIITNGNPTGRHNAAVVLNILSTARGDSLLNKLIDENKLADSTKAFVLKDRKEFISQGKTELTATNEEAIRKERQESMPGLSDEGLGRYFRLTGTLMALRNKKYGLLYKQ
ncbi:hypothetical protein IDJ77_16080 [Mucilaginibacter sp. ZT4R22]|uniref:Uncharacterized protein n=1 Tax=Mucilaginibacter pankratovii TaxID=2772110 RepID=A0ABR7WSQ6_9SPHI|nr:hypothetical protein [Mucilaginibacter pankratovii]MBD1365336.1 hypothetical protein [Mucilaginibacter pankratovii]